MNLKNILWVLNTGHIAPKAPIGDNLFGLKLSGGGTEEKTIDFMPVISVSDAITGNAIDYQFRITAKQEGTPSPQNICPITGWMGANIGHANGAVTIEDGEIVISCNQSGTGNPSPSNIRPILPGLTLEMDDSSTLEIYGAKLNPVTGTLTATHTISAIDENMDGGVASVGGVWYSNGVNNSNILTDYCGLTACDAYKLHTGVGNTSSAKNVLALYEFCGCTQSGNKTRVFFRDERFTSNTALREWLAENPVYVVYELAEPITYNLSQTELARALTALGVEIIPVSWQSEAGIVYGGVRNLTTGELTDNAEYITLDGTEDWTYQTLDDRRFFRLNLGASGYVAQEGICDQYVRKSIRTDNTDVGFNVAFSSDYYHLRFRPENVSGMSVNDWKNMLANQPVHVVIYKSEPITYTLTPTDIVLAEGANTLWSDTGDSKLTYKAKK